jgi:hypothetical protein
MNKRGQLFLIEVVIALSVLIVLISALFSVQTFDNSQPNETLFDNGQQAIDLMVDNGLIFQYLGEANYSFYTLGSEFFDPLNETKQEVEYTIDGILPPLANFKVFTERYNPTTLTWDPIDVINLEQTLPTGSEIVSLEQYFPGFGGVFDQFTFQLMIWYEVS